MQEKEVAQEENSRLIALAEWEDILEKKAKIYSRLLTEAALAKTMESLSLRHEQRKQRLLALACGEPLKKKNGQGRCAMNGGEEEK
jgi:hypothetical protein